MKNLYQLNDIRAFLLDKDVRISSVHNGHDTSSLMLRVHQLMHHTEDPMTLLHFLEEGDEGVQRLDFNCGTLYLFYTDIRLSHDHRFLCFYLQGTLVNVLSLSSSPFEKYSVFPQEQLHQLELVTL